MRIAVYGKLRAGKTAVCDYIIEKFDCEILECSGALQEIVDILYPDKKGIKDRELLVTIGQHLRKIDEDIWVNLLEHKIKNSNAENILIAGVRQQNEYDMLKRQGFIFIQVEACENTRIERCIENGDKFSIESLRNHTEMVMDNWKPDYLIINEKGFKELEISISNVINQVLSIEMNKKLRDSFFREGLKRFFEETEELKNE